jgi:hypothetical protein
MRTSVELTLVAIEEVETVVNRNKPYGLYHKFEGEIGLRGEDANRETTILPLLAHDQGLQHPEEVHVNPSNDDYAGIQNSHTIYGNSKVHKMHITWNLSLLDDGNLNALIYKWAFITTSFKDIDLEDEDGDTIGSILKLQWEATNENQVHPIYNNTTVGPAGSAPPTVEGLTTSTVLEGVAMGENPLEEKIRVSSLGGKIKKSVMPGGLQRDVIYKDRPYVIDRWYDVPGKVKTGNRGMFCGLLLKVPQFGNVEQFYDEFHVTNKDHFRLGYEVEYWEYNDMFQQSA